MEKRTLGNTDLELSIVGLGTGAIGGDGWDFGWGPQTEADSFAAIDEAIEVGVNWVDTAPIYGHGRAEEILGRALRRRKERIYVATKCGLMADDRGRIGPQLDTNVIRREVDASRKRLGADSIDLYQIHSPNPESQIEFAWDTLQELRHEGKIRWAGVSNFNVRQLTLISRIAPVSSLQPPYSALSRDVEAETIPWCIDAGTGVIAYSPMQSGILTSKFSRDWINSLPTTDWRKTRSPFLKPWQLGALDDFVNGMKVLASNRGCTLATYAVAWVLSRTGVTSAICGARRPGQVAETAMAAGLQIDPREREEMDRLFRAYQEAIRH